MPRKTSVYLSDEVDALVRAEMARGVPLRDIITRGVGAVAPDEALVRAAVAAAHEDMYASVEEIVERKVKSALREAQGGGGAW